MAILQKELIANKAMQMFVSQGIKAVRMDDIASQLGVSKRTIYEIYGDKEELIFQAMKCHFDKFHESNGAVMRSAENVLVGMILVIDNVVKSAEDNWRLRNSLKRFYPKVNDRLHQDGVGNRYSVFRQSLELGVKEGLLVDNVNLDLAIAMLYYMAAGIVDDSRRFVLPEGVSLAEAFKEVVMNFMRGISTAKGIDIIDKFIKTQIN